MAAEASEPGNPIARTFDSLATEFLTEHLGEEITLETIRDMSELLTSVNLVFMGITEASKLLGVSRQRTSQLLHGSGAPQSAGNIEAGSFWIDDDIKSFKVARQARVDKHTYRGPRTDS